MTVKAQCLFAAGVITEAQKQAIENRAVQTICRRPALRGGEDPRDGARDAAERKDGVIGPATMVMTIDF
jgi:hypothetical protein